MAADARLGGGGREEARPAPRPWAARGGLRRRRGRSRRGGSLDGTGGGLRRDRPRRDAARRRRLRDLSPPARRRSLDARPDADGSRRRRGPRRGARRRSRRLSHEAVRLRGAPRADPRAHPPRSGRAPGRARGRGAPSRSCGPPGVAGRRRARPVREGVRHARALHATPRRDIEPHPAARRRLGHRLREPLHRDGPRGGLPPARGDVSRLPIRVRLTLGFAVAMAVVLAVVGIFVYRRVSNELLATVDQTLVGQSREAGETGRVDADTGSGPTLAQLFDARGDLRHSQPKALGPLVDRQVLAEAHAGERVWLDKHLPGRTGEWRVLAAPALSRDGVVVLARSLEPRTESLDHLRHELLVFLPLALLAASLGGYALAAGALRPVEVLRRRAQAVTADAPAVLPVPDGGDEISRLAITLNQMLERLHAAVEHERRFVADASHELRTPLALLQTELDLALRRPRSREELESALRSAAEETQRLSRLADDLLLIAR